MQSAGKSASKKGILPCYFLTRWVTHLFRPQGLMALATGYSRDALSVDYIRNISPKAEGSADVASRFGSRRAGL